MSGNKKGRILSWIIVFFLITLIIITIFIELFNESCDVDTIDDVDFEYTGPNNLPQINDAWIIVDDEYDLRNLTKFENTIIYLRSDIDYAWYWLDQNEEDIIFNNVTLYINCTNVYNYPKTFEFNGHHKLFLNNSTITVSNTNYHYNIRCNNIIFNNGLISNANEIYFSRSQHVSNASFINNRIIYFRDNNIWQTRNIVVTNSTFINSRIQLQDTDASFENCYFYNNYYGIEIDNEGPLKCKYCLFENNLNAIYNNNNAYMNISYCIFLNNSLSIKGLASRGKLENNYWGTTSVEMIQTEIEDKNADFNPWLLEPPFEIQGY